MLPAGWLTALPASELSRLRAACTKSSAGSVPLGPLLLAAAAGLRPHLLVHGAAERSRIGAERP